MSRRASGAGVPRQDPGDEVGHELGHGVRHVLLGIHDRRQHAEEAGVVGDRVEVERGVELDVEARGVGQGLALRVPVGVVGRGPGAVEEGVVREVGVRVEVAEVGVAQGVRLCRRGGGCGRLRCLHRRAAVAVAGAARGRQADERGGADGCGGAPPEPEGISGTTGVTWHDTSPGRGIVASRLRCPPDQILPQSAPFQGARGEGPRCTRPAAHPARVRRSAEQRCSAVTCRQGAPSSPRSSARHPAGVRAMRGHGLGPAIVDEIKPTHPPAASVPSRKFAT